MALRQSLSPMQATTSALHSLVRQAMSLVLSLPPALSAAVSVPTPSALLASVVAVSVEPVSAKSVSWNVQDRR